VPTATTDPALDTRRTQCAEVWGGNQTVHTNVELPGLRGVLYSRSCSGGSGGDVHALSVCGSGLLSRICIADVVGHGEAVARVGELAHAFVRRFSNWPDQRRMLRSLNQSLVREDLSALTTAAALTYYPPSRRLTVGYAGHPPGWYYRRRDETWSRLYVPTQHPATHESPYVDCPLGVSRDSAFTSQRVRIDAGDRLLLVTDGVLEAPDDENVQFGSERVASLLEQTRSGSLTDASTALLAALSQHCVNGEFGHDDVTFLLLEFVDAPRGPAWWHVVRNRLLRPLAAAGAKVITPRDRSSPAGSRGR
jgi:serine phosphatase RsbU (regulator of sigma subunit)